MNAMKEMNGRNSRKHTIKENRWNRQPHESEEISGHDVWQRAAMGIPIGITIGYLITILTSLFYGGGQYIAVNEDLVQACGSSMNAILVQTGLYILIGAVCGGASCIWQIESWSLLKQSAIFFVLIAGVVLAGGWFGCWMPHSLAGFGLYCFLFVNLFVLIWVFSYLKIRAGVKKMNRTLSDSR